MPSFNDFDLNDWKNLDIYTDSLWLIPERDKTGKHNGFYHGNFIPQIPHQLILRYSKKDEIIFDPFVGSGTTAFESENLNRNFIGIDIQEGLINYIKGKINNQKNFLELITDDSASEKTFDKVVKILEQHNKKTIQLAILHPPYADIIKFSNHKEDLSNCKSLREFLDNFAKVIKNTIKILEKNRYLALIMGDKYTKGQWIPLGFYCMNKIQKLGLTLKSVIIKNIEGNRAKQNKEAIWKYRALANDYYIFKHEYIFIFKY